jgi:hypothetical protein
MSAALVDPFAQHQPDITPEEWVAIRDEIWDRPWDDAARFPDLLREAVKVLGEVGMGGDPFSRRIATQCLRGMLYRTKSGVPYHEPEPAAWELDTERFLPRAYDSDDRVSP